MSDIVKKAVETLKGGGVILLPTETVYGIAADARNKSAVEKIYYIKNRDHSKPLQIMVHNITEAEKLADFNDKARSLAEKHWPGALTIILKQRTSFWRPIFRTLGAGGKLKLFEELSKNFNKIDNTIGIRIPAHPIALEILEQFGSPLAVTSANISGNNANINFSEAKKLIGDKLDLLIDGGESDIGVSSTVVDLTDERYPKIIRQGSIVV